MGMGTYFFCAKNTDLVGIYSRVRGCTATGTATSGFSLIRDMFLIDNGLEPTAAIIFTPRRGTSEVIVRKVWSYNMDIKLECVI